MCRGRIKRLSSQRSGLCQLIGCCLSAPQLLFSALLCELELDCQRAQWVGCVNKGRGRDTARHSRGGDFPFGFLCDFSCSGCGCQQRHSPSSVLPAPQWEDACRPVLVCQHPGRWPPALQHRPAAPPRTSLEPQQMASCGPVSVCDTRANPWSGGLQPHALQGGLISAWGHPLPSLLLALLFSLGSGGGS